MGAVGGLGRGVNRARFECNLSEVRPYINDLSAALRNHDTCGLLAGENKPGTPITVRKRGYSIRGRAVCSESCMYGSEGGAGKRTGRLAVSTAPVPPPYWGHYGYADSAVFQPPTPLSWVVRVRHEGVAETVLLFWKEVTTPAVLPAVSYRGVRPGQRGGAKPSGQRILIPRDGSPGVSRRLRLPASRWLGTRRAWYGQPR